MVPINKRCGRKDYLGKVVTRDPFCQGESLILFEFKIIRTLKLAAASEVDAYTSGRQDEFEVILYVNPM